MYQETIHHFIVLIEHKIARMERSPVSLYVGGILAGAYVTLATILIITLGNDVPPSLQKLIMGGTFGVALTLVLFAGSELFTGYAMYIAFAILNKKTLPGVLLKLAGWIWLANLLGALLVSAMYVLGEGSLIKNGSELLYQIAHNKMNKSATALFFNGILCNWLVCLAIWMSKRMSSEVGKLIAIFSCLLIFIASGFEHCIANMSIFSLAMMGDEYQGINLINAVWNLLWVTLGNILGGGIFVGVAYWYLSSPSK